MPEIKKLSWEETMKKWHSLPSEEFHLLRRYASRSLSEGGAEEVGTSDVNGKVHGLLVWGEDPQDFIKEQRRYEEEGWNA